MRQEAPIGFLIIIQLIGVMGDTLSQRCLRVVHKYSYRRFLTSLSIVSLFIIFFILSFFQIFYSDSLRRVDKLFQTTTIINDNNNHSSSSSSPTTTNTTDWKMIDICSPSALDNLLQNNSSNETTTTSIILSWIDRIAIEEKRKSCFSQGPLTIWRIVYACPMVLLVGALNLPLYFSYPILLRDASGVVLFSIALTAAALLVQPLSQFEGESNGEDDGTTNLVGIKALAILLGIIGAVICTFEKKIGLRDQIQERRRRRLSTSAGVDDNREEVTENGNSNEDTGAIPEYGQSGGAGGTDDENQNDESTAAQDAVENNRSELVEMMADEDIERMPINDEGFRRSSRDAPLTFWDFVDRAALDSSEAYRNDDDDAVSYWCCCFCAPSADDLRHSSSSDSCCCCPPASSCRIKCCCCFKTCWTPFWRAVVKTVSNAISRFGKFIRALPPFIAVVSCVSIWMALMRYLQDHCDINPYGVVTADQMFLPFFILPMIFIWDFMSSAKHLLLLLCCSCGYLLRRTNDDGGDERPEGGGNYANPYFSNSSSRMNNNSNSSSSEHAQNPFSRGRRIVELHGRDDREETFGQMFSHSWKELKQDYCSGLLQVVLARILVAAKQLGYGFLIIWYDVRSFAEMSLAQILLSWLATALCVLLIPSIIHATPDEQRSIRYSWNIVAKIFGSLLVIASVFLMHSAF